MNYNCTDMVGRYFRMDTSLRKNYSLTIGLGSDPENCPVLTNSARSIQTRSVYCPVGYVADSAQGVCYKLKDESCPIANPIQCAGGQKGQVEIDFSLPTSPRLEFARYYSSSGFYTSLGVERKRDILGLHWRHSWQSSVVMEQRDGESYAYVIQPSGDYRRFQLSGGDWVGRLDRSESLQEVVSSGVRAGWLYTANDDSIYRYDENGIWVSLSAVAA